MSNTTPGILARAEDTNDRMNRDDIIEKATRAMAADTYGTPDAWDVWVTDKNVRDGYRQQARAALHAAGVDLPPEPEPLPMHQVRLQPATKYAWQKLPLGWRCAQLTRYLTDGDVRSWPVMEVVDPAEDTEDTTREEYTVDMHTPEGRLAAFKATPLGTKVSATHEGRQENDVNQIQHLQDVLVALVAEVGVDHLLTLADLCEIVEAASHRVDVHRWKA